MMFAHSKKKVLSILLVAVMTASMFVGEIGSSAPVYAAEEAADYESEELLDVETDSAEFRVHFELSGISSAMEDRFVPAGSLLERPEDPAAEGFVFTGWYADAECRTPWDFEQYTVTEDLMLYAGWQTAYQEPAPSEAGQMSGSPEEVSGETLAGKLETAVEDGKSQQGGGELQENGELQEENGELQEEEEAVEADETEDLLRDDGTDPFNEGTPGNWGGSLMGLTAATNEAQGKIDSGELSGTVTVAVIDSGAVESYFAGRIDEASCSFIGGSYASDPEGHGTHVAGIIAENTPSSVKLMILKALDDNNEGYADHVAEAIRYAADHGADIINLSLGTSESGGGPGLSSEDRKRVGQAIYYAQGKGCVVVTSAGNDGSEITGNEAYPAGAPGVLTVAALTEGLQLCEFSNYGSTVTYCAPGRQITSANGNKSGTSMAAANVSAALAIAKLYNPGASGTELENLLRSCSDTVTCTISEEGQGDRVYTMAMPHLPAEMEYLPAVERPERPVITKMYNYGMTLTIEWDAIPGVEYIVRRGRLWEAVSSYREIGRVTCDTDKGIFEFEYSEKEGSRYDGYEGLYFYEIESVDKDKYKNSHSQAEEYQMPTAGMSYRPQGKSVINVGETVTLDAGWSVWQEDKWGNGRSYVQIYNSAKWDNSNEDVVQMGEVVNETYRSSEVNVTGLKQGVSTITFTAPTGAVLEVKIRVNPDTAAEGQCGDNLFYKVEDNGSALTLVIYGEGDMWDGPFKWDISTVNTVRIEDGVTSIGAGAFWNSHSNVIHVEGMKDVTKIGENAFNDCAKLKEFELPEGLTEIGEDAFARTAIDWAVPEDHQFFSSKDGVLFNKEQTRLIAVSIEKEGSYVIPETVKELDPSTFGYNNHLSEIEIPNSFTVLPYDQFISTSLQTLHLPDTIKIIEGHSPYSDTFANAIETIPANLEYIGRNAFSGMIAEKVVLPEKVTVISPGTFSNAQIGYLELPEGISELPNTVFKQANIGTLVLPVSLRRISNEVFNETQYKDFELDKILYRGFTSQFKGILFVEEPYNHDNAKEIFDSTPLFIETGGEWNGFTWKAEGPSGDVTLTISGEGDLPDVYDEDSVPWKEGISEITKVVLEDGITGIGEFGFFNYPHLKEIHMTDSMQSYGANALRGVPELDTFVYCPGDKDVPMNVYVEYLVFLEEEGLTDGLSARPAIEVTCGDGTVLKEGEDFTVTYPKYPKDGLYGQRLVRIEFKGTYADYGTFCVPLVVTQKLLEGENIKALKYMALSPYNFVYDGGRHVPSATVYGGSRNGVLRSGTNFRLSYSNPNSAAVNSYTVTARGIGGYYGSVSANYSISKASVAGAAVSGIGGSYTYTGKAITPSPTVSVGGRGLANGRDYTVSYQNNVNAGTATVYIYGRGNYTGTRAVNFTIGKADQSMTAKAKEPKIAVGGQTSVVVSGAKGRLTYVSSDTSVAAVKPDGTVTGKKDGTVRITVYAEGNGNYKSASGSLELTVGSGGKPAAGVTYQTHVQTYGWQKWKKNGELSGTEGESKRLEAINIKLVDAPYEGGIEYQTHVQTYGWQSWKADGAMAGTSGESKRLEAIRIRLTGEMAKQYDVYYRTHVQTFGWSGWTSNGEMCGSAGFSKRLEAIQILLVAKGSGAPGSATGAFYQKSDGQEARSSGALVGYNTHVQTYGWQNYVYDGAMAGTSGKSKRLEGIHISLIDKPYSGDIVYRTHVQTYGWQGWKKNGQMSGTSGQSKRLEGIQIYLTGEMAKHYDVYYRVHAQTYGWLGWAKNGEMAGTSGLSKRLEGINIQLVPKGGAAPGSTARPNVVGSGGKLPDNPYKG